MKKYDNVEAEVLKQLGKRKRGFTARELAEKLDLSIDYTLTQVKKLREGGKVEKEGGREPTYKLAA